MLRKAMPAIACAVCACSSAAPLPAPANFNGIFSETEGLFAWDPVPGATGYAIEVDRLGTRQSFTTKDTRIGIQWPLGVSNLFFKVRSQCSDGPCPWSNSLAQPSQFPHFSLDLEGVDATLSWGSSRDRVEIARGPSADALSVVAETSGSSFVDRGLPSAQTLFWRVALLSPPVSIMSQPLSGTVAPPPPTAVHVAYDPPNVTVTWDPIDGAVGYAVQANGTSGAATFILPTAQIGPVPLAPCELSPFCTYQIAAMSASFARGVFSEPFRVTAPPVEPRPPLARSALGQHVALTMPPLPLGADHFAILRSQGAAFEREDG